MKSLSLSIMLLLFAPFAVTETISVHGTVAQAEVFARTVNLIVTSGLDVNGSPATLLTFHTTSFNPDGTLTFVIGSGTIPDDRFTKEGFDKMNLTVDTSQVAGYSNTTCILTPFPNFGFHCNPSQGGPIQVSWHDNGLNSEDQSRNVDTTFGPTTRHEQGYFQFSSADVEGSVVGTPFNLSGSDFDAFMDLAHFAKVSITKN